MIGQKSFEIGPADWQRGVTSAANTQDGGLSPESGSMNLIAAPGVLYPPGAITDKSTNLTSQMIASCEDPTYLGKDRMFLDEAAAFYWWDGSSLTKKVTASSDKVTQGTSDFVPWHDGTTQFWFATTSAGANGDIIRWDGATTLVEDFWTNASYLNQSALSAVTPWRPFLVYETYLYLGNKNVLQRITSATAQSGILTLNTSETISALGVDKGSGKMLVATTLATDYSASRNGRSRLYLYNGSSNKADKVMDVSGTITAIKNVDDMTIIFYGNKMGYFTGSGIKFMRKLNFAIGTAANLVYPHKATVIDNTLYWVEGSTAMAFGEVTAGGGKVFYPCLAPDTSSQLFTCLTTIGGNKLGYSYSSSKFFTHDITAVATVVNGGTTVYSKRYAFPRPVTFNGILFELNEAAPANQNTFSVRIKDNKGNTTTTISMNPGARTDVWEYEYTYPNLELRTLQVLLTWGANGVSGAGIRRATVFYTPKE